MLSAAALAEAAVEEDEDELAGVVDVGAAGYVTLTETMSQNC
jgi:hypothetical protein